MHPDTLHRYSGYRASCKQWGVALGVGILLVGALGKLEAGTLLFAALPLLLLGLVEAGYAGQERRCLELLKAKKGNDELAGLLPEEASSSFARTARAAVSVAVWPFYLGLYGIVAAGSGALPTLHHDSAPSVIATATGARGGCGSGGCGSAKGCGSGGCGASAGKACSCSGGTTKPTVQRVAQVPPQYVQPQQYAQSQPYAQPPQYAPAAAGPMPLSQAATSRPLNGTTMPVRQPLNQPMQRIAPPVGPLAPAAMAAGTAPVSPGLDQPVAAPREVPAVPPGTAAGSPAAAPPPGATVPVAAETTPAAAPIEAAAPAVAAPAPSAPVPSAPLPSAPVVPTAKKPVR